MLLKPALLLAATLIATSAHATTVAQWDYNAGTTKHTISQNGASFAALSVTTAFVSGAGSSDLAATNNALNTSTYAVQGAESGARGVQYNIDTSGYENLIFSFDQRNSATASAWSSLAYTLDGGGTWTDATTFKMAADSVFSKGISYSFASILGANDNPDFGLRLVSIFAPGTSAYIGTGTAGTYATGGTIRYDMVTLAGSEIAAAPVPEPTSMVMMLAGLAGIGFVAARRRRV